MRILATIAVLACTCLTVQAKETLYRCAHNSSNEEISLTLKSEDGATTITIGSKNGNRTYFVSETTPGTYRGESKNSEAPEAFSSLELDRFSSELRVQERVSYAVTKVLADVCRKNISVAECRTMVGKVSEADIFLCGTTADGQCPRWLAGVNTYFGAALYKCRPAGG